MSAVSTKNRKIKRLIERPSLKNEEDQDVKPSKKPKRRYSRRVQNMKIEIKEPIKTADHSEPLPVV